MAKRHLAERETQKFLQKFPPGPFSMDAKALFLGLLLSPAALAGEYPTKLDLLLEDNEQMFRDMDAQAEHAAVLRRLDRIEQGQRALANSAREPAAVSAVHDPALAESWCKAYPQSSMCQ